MAKEDIISDIEEKRHHCDIVQNSAESSEHRPEKIGVVEKLGRRSP